MKRTFDYFAGDCIGSDAESINSMTERAHSVTYTTLLRHVPRALLAELFTFYAWGPGQPGELRLKDDWAVGYYKSTYRRRACYYIDHSRIEYIFTEPGRKHHEKGTMERHQKR